MGKRYEMSSIDKLPNQPEVPPEKKPEVEEGPSRLKTICVLALVAMIIAAPALGVIAVPLVARHRGTFDHEPSSGNALGERITFASCPSHTIIPSDTSEVPAEIFKETVEVVENPLCESVEPFDVDAPPQQIFDGKFSDCRSLTRQFTDSVYSLGRSAADAVYKIPSVVKSVLGSQHPYHVNPLNGPPEWKEGSQGLYVMVHGLKGQPSAWNAYADALDELHDAADQAIMIVPKGGNCRVADAAEPILKVVEDYIEKNPGKPISLLGTSNGARIVAYIETKLRESAPKTPILVSAIAGANYGSGVMNTVHEYGISKILGYTPEIMEELKYGSEVSKQTLDAQRVPLPQGVERDFSYYMTTEETHIHPPTSELPIIDQGERHFVVHGEGHSSIVGRVLPHLLSHATKWMKERSK